MSRSEFEEVLVHEPGKRLGMVWTTWMGDWFVSYSPRNSNSNAEGPWDQWVDLALAILHDPLTAITRPDVAHLAATLPEPLDQYDSAQRYVTEDELATRFPDTQEPS